MPSLPVEEILNILRDEGAIIRERTMSERPLTINYDIDLPRNETFDIQIWQRGFNVNISDAEISIVDRQEINQFAIYTYEYISEEYIPGGEYVRKAVINIDTDSITTITYDRIMKLIEIYLNEGKIQIYIGGRR